MNTINTITVENPGNVKMRHLPGSIDRHCPKCKYNIQESNVNEKPLCCPECGWQISFATDPSRTHYSLYISLLLANGLWFSMSLTYWGNSYFALKWYQEPLLQFIGRLVQCRWSNDVAEIATYTAFISACLIGALVMWHNTIVRLPWRALIVANVAMWMVLIMHWKWALLNMRLH